MVFLEEADTIRALRQADGSVAWMAAAPGQLTAPLNVAGDRLFVATRELLLCYRAADGLEEWRQPLKGVHSVPAVKGDRLYVSLDDGRVAAIRSDDGRLLWDRKIGGLPNDILALEAQILVGSTDNFLYSLNAVSGEIAWRRRTGADVVHRPAADAHNVYFVSLDNVLRAVNRSHGVQQWMRPLPFRPAWPPVLAMDAVVVAGLTPPIRAYFLKDGAADDAFTPPAGGEIAAPLYTLEAPGAFGPMIIVITRSVAGQTTVVAVSRSVEPPAASTLAPLPNLTSVAVPR